MMTWYNTNMWRKIKIDIEHRPVHWGVQKNVCIPDYEKNL